jgi:hypothetical protein
MGDLFCLYGIEIDEERARDLKRDDSMCSYYYDVYYFWGFYGPLS